MATVTVTNTKYSQALRGQDVIVTVTGSTNVAKLQQISVGDAVASGAAEGTVSSVDYYGHTFHVTPLQPNFSFATPGVPGYFTSGANVVVTIS